MLLVLYGCETWCVILRKEHWLRVCKNRVLRKVKKVKQSRYRPGVAQRVPGS